MGKIVRSFAWVAVFETAEVYRTDLELSADEPHELYSSDEEVASAVSERKSASFEEQGIHERDLALSWIVFIEAPVPGSISVALESLSCDHFDLGYSDHARACFWRDTNAIEYASHVVVLMRMVTFLRPYYRAPQPKTSLLLLVLLSLEIDLEAWNDHDEDTECVEPCIFPFCAVGEEEHYEGDDRDKHQSHDDLVLCVRCHGCMIPQGGD